MPLYTIRSRLKISLEAMDGFLTRIELDHNMIEGLPVMRNRNYTYTWLRNDREAASRLAAVSRRGWLRGQPVCIVDMEALQPEAATKALEELCQCERQGLIALQHAGVTHPYKCVYRRLLLSLLCGL